jgi:hypothetical protein
MQPPDALTHGVALACLAARLGDIGSTWLGTPQLRLEANTLARRWRWPYALATVLLALVPYYSLPAGIVILVGSLLVCSSNLSKLWLMRALGEDRYHDFLVDCAGRASVPWALSFILASGVAMASVGVVLAVTYPGQGDEPGFAVALGILAYAAAMVIWGSLAFLRHRAAASQRK